MTREDAFKTIKENLCGMCVYGSQCMESCDIRSCDNRDAIEVLQAQDLQLTCNNLATDTIGRQAAIDAINHICPVDTEYDCTLLDRVDVRYVLSDLPSAQPEPCEDKLKEIADALSEKMCYMNTCPNERDIILGYLGCKRSSKNHCNTDCWNEKCESYHYETKQQPELCEDTVSRNTLKEYFSKRKMDADIMKEVFDAIDLMPSVTPKRKTGKWIYPHETTTLVSICSECGAHGRGNFCPNCGAEMDGGEQDDT